MCKNCPPNSECILDTNTKQYQCICKPGLQKIENFCIPIKSKRKFQLLCSNIRKIVSLDEVHCHECIDCIQPKENDTISCPLGIQTCQLTLTGFASNDMKIDRNCGPMNTSVHQCIGLRKDNTRQSIMSNEVIQDSQFENVSFVCGQSSDCLGKYSASSEIWDIFCQKKSLYLRCIDQFTQYQIHKNDSTTVFCNATGTIFVFGKPDTSRILANTDNYNAKYINTFLKNQTDEGIRIAIPAYSKYFLDTNIKYASQFMDCKYGYKDDEDAITCVCNSQLCNGMNQEDLVHFLSCASINQGCVLLLIFFIVSIEIHSWH